uniref:Hydroxylysine kinase n=1 Tax=Pavo cristatus TaxID=9049 RepID=A0A8C9EGI4_PAVCR
MASTDHQPPQAATKPAFGEEEAAELVDKVFGLKVVWVRPLPSYDDQNFHVKVSSGGEAEGAEEYVLKITNSEDSQQPALIEAQTQAMVFLSAHGFPSAVPQLTKDGGIMSLQAGGEQLQDRTDTALPAALSEIQILIYGLFSLVLLLQEFHHPSVRSLHRGQFIWNLANVPLLDQYIDALGQNKHRDVVEWVIQQFKEKVTPKISSFRACECFILNHVGVCSRKLGSQTRKQTHRHSWLTVIKYCFSFSCV